MAVDKVPFKLTHMQCCGTMLCCVNPRPYNFCPECGERLTDGKRRVLVSDDSATLSYDTCLGDGINVKQL